MNEEIEMIAQKLRSEYKSYVLSVNDVCKILKVSETKLYRWRKENINLPYRKSGDANNSPIQYSVFAIAKYIYETENKMLL